MVFRGSRFTVHGSRFRGSRFVLVLVIEWCSWGMGHGEGEMRNGECGVRSAECGGMGQI